MMGKQSIDNTDDEMQMQYYMMLLDLDLAIKYCVHARNKISALSKRMDRLQIKGECEELLKQIQESLNNEALGDELLKRLSKAQYVFDVKRVT